MNRNREWLARGVAGVVIFVVLLAVVRRWGDTLSAPWIINLLLLSFLTAFGTLRCFWLAFDREAAQTVRLEEEDERNRYLRQKSASTAFAITRWGCEGALAALLILWYWKGWRDVLFPYIVSLFGVYLLSQVSFYLVQKYNETHG